MTNQEINNQIAIGIMGWFKPEKGQYWAYKREDGYTDYTGYMQQDATMGLMWNPAGNIAHAFEVRDKIREEIFSVRMKFKKALQRIISDRLNRDDFVMIHPEEIILYVQPADICLAALEAVKDK